jgi:glutaredoxin
MLELYQIVGCPFCSKVRTRLCDHGIDYIARIVPRNKSKDIRMKKFLGSRTCLH